VTGNPGRELEVDSNELARPLEWLDSFPILPPHLVRKLARQILVVDVLLSDRPERGYDVLRQHRCHFWKQLEIQTSAASMARAYDAPRVALHAAYRRCCPQDSGGVDATAPSPTIESARRR
jgi:hypothetical protein